MSTNIIDVTNVVTITNLEVVTNTLNKIDIMSIPTSRWDIASVIINLFVAGIMLYTVYKMSEQNKLSAASVQEMKKQPVYEQLIKYEEIYNKTLFNILSERKKIVK